MCSLTQDFPRDGAPGSQAQAQGALARAHRDNHHLPLRKGVPTPAQIAITEQALQVLLRSLQASLPDRQLLRAGLTVRLILDLGRDEEHLSRLSRIHVGERDSTPSDAWGLMSWNDGDDTRYGWWLQAGVHVDQDKSDAAEEIRGVVWLPLAERTIPWLALAGLIDDMQHGPLLPGNAQDLENNVAAFKAWATRTLGALGGAIPSGGRLSWALTEQLAWHPTGDRTLAMQLTGRDMNHSNARSYYTSVPVPRAAKLYAAAIQSPVSPLSQTASGPNGIAIPAYAYSALTRKEPKGSLDQARTAFGSTATKPDKRANDDRTLIADHNMLVAKLWIALALSTASREKHEMLPGLQRIEPRTGSLMVLDKKRKADEPQDEPEGARLVILHKAVREMLEYYRDHLRTLANRPTFDEKSKARILDHAYRLGTEGSQPFLVLEERAGRLAALEAEATWIERALGEYQMPQANFARHSLRSGLIGDVPQSAIDALLGHFDRGTYPWSKGSAFDPAAYRALLNVIFEANFAELAHVVSKPKNTA